MTTYAIAQTILEMLNDITIPMCEINRVWNEAVMM